MFYTYHTFLQLNINTMKHSKWSPKKERKSHKTSVCASSHKLKYLKLEGWKR